MAVSSYIHIPFCSHKCDFCDFAAFAGVNHLEDEYTDIVCKEIEQRLAGNPCEGELSSVFYGGGTPGLVKAETLGRIYETLSRSCRVSSSAEVTLETTPHAITDDKVKAWTQIGINRISIGIESLQDSELSSIGRDHTRSQAYEGVRLACENGFENVSCDFMYVLPTQTVASWRETLADFVGMSHDFPQIKHVSAYGLHLANNSPLFSRFPKGAPEYPDDETFSVMYDTLVETLADAGFTQYEVSNFARPGFESTHNLAYWQNAEYYGFGVSAHRYIAAVRSANWRSLARYMKDCLGSEFSEHIDEETRIREAIMLGLRMRAGIDLQSFASEYGFDLAEKLKNPLQRLLDGGFVELSESHLRLTHKGVPISNSIIADLI
jgi:oxygen-independent coproporphyrinogen-3 oxidase